MTFYKQVQPPRLRLRYRAMQSAGCCAILLAFVLWTGAFAKRLEEADREARERSYLLQEHMQDMEREVHDLQYLQVHEGRHRWPESGGIP